MMEIRLYPDPMLRRRAKPVEEIDSQIKALADSMVETLIKRVGYGLAAPQVGVLKRLIVVDVEDELYMLANPKIVEASEERELGVEGCLSLPGIEAEVERAKSVRIEGLNLEGERVTISAEGLLARVFQHEIDHLDGILFIDYLGRARRQRLLREYEKKLKEEPEVRVRAKVAL
jgi:peptide deformylase